MFRNKQPEVSPLDEPIKQLLVEMANVNPDSDEYGKMVHRLEKLHEMRRNERPSRVSNDTLVNAAVHLGGIAFIVGHERTHVVTSKAMQFIRSMR